MNSSIVEQAKGLGTCCIDEDSLYTENFFRATGVQLVKEYPYLPIYVIKPWYFPVNTVYSTKSFTLNAAISYQYS